MQVFPLCIPKNLWCSQMSVRVSFLILISITIITVQGWPEDRELRDSYRLSDMATATTPTMVNGTIWKVFWFKVFPDDARSPWIRFATKTWMSADQVKQRSKRHLWHALWPGRRTICGTFVQHTFRDKNFVNFRDKMLFFGLSRKHTKRCCYASALCATLAHIHMFTGKHGEQPSHPAPEKPGSAWGRVATYQPSNSTSRWWVNDLHFAIFDPFCYIFLFCHIFALAAGLPGQITESRLVRHQSPTSLSPLSSLTGKKNPSQVGKQPWSWKIQVCSRLQVTPIKPAWASQYSEDSWGGGGLFISHI